MQVLVEEYLAEAKKESGTLFIEGIGLMSQTRNRNKRVYPHEILKPEADRYINEEIEKNKAYGECPHPDYMDIKPDNVSHRIRSLKEDGCLWIAKSSILDTPKGNIVRAIVEDGGSIGLSSRGSGSLRESRDKDTKIVSSYKMKCIDLVIDPSVADSVMTALYEHKEVMYCEDEKCYMLVEDINCKLKNSRDREQIVLEQFQRYLNHIKL
jgi:hypothetical protein